MATEPSTTLGTIDVPVVGNAVKGTARMIFPEVDRGLAVEYRANGWWRDTTLVDDLRALSITRTDDVALVSHCAESDVLTRLTFGELWDRVNDIAARLISLGVRPLEIVSFQLPNCWEFTAVYMACARIGAVAHSIQMIHREHEIEVALRRVHSRVSITVDRFRGFQYGAAHAALVDKLPELEHVLVLRRTGERSSDRMLLEELTIGADATPKNLEALDRRRVRSDDPEIVMFTSGTTGEPKGVVHSHNTLYASAITALDETELTVRDVIISPSPMSHMTGLLCGVLMPIIGGLRSVLLDVWSPSKFVEILMDEKATFSWGVPTYWVDLLGFPVDEDYRLASLRTIICSGSPIPRSLARAVEDRWNIGFRPNWGMTETSGVTFVSGDADRLRCLETDGRASHGSELKIVDAEGRALAAGTDGRLLVRGPSRFLGYLGRPELTQSAVDTEGWLDSGDIANMDPEGYIRISGRVKDIIIRGGENIPVTEIEDALDRHPAIAEAAIVGCPDERLGERAVAIVRLRNRHDRLTLDDVRSHLAGLGVAKHYWPEMLKTIDEMPRTESGKTQKFVLRSMVANERISD